MYFHSSCWNKNKKKRFVLSASRHEFLSNTHTRSNTNRIKSSSFNLLLWSNVQCIDDGHWHPLKTNSFISPSLMLQDFCNLYATNPKNLDKLGYYYSLLLLFTINNYNYLFTINLYNLNEHFFRTCWLRKNCCSNILSSRNINSHLQHHVMYCCSGLCWIGFDWHDCFSPAVARPARERVRFTAPKNRTAPLKPSIPSRAVSGLVRLVIDPAPRSLRHAHTHTQTTPTSADSMFIYVWCSLIDFLMESLAYKNSFQIQKIIFFNKYNLAPLVW